MTPISSTSTAAVSEPDYAITQLDNGLTVAAFPMPWLHETSVTLYVRAGSRFEQENEAGIAHFLEHMFFKGTKRIPDATRLHERLEELAADMNASTGPESNSYWITLPPRFLSEGMTLFCEMFTQPHFGGLENERQVILAEMREDENDAGEVNNAMVLGCAKLWENHPLGRPVIGYRECVSKFNKTDLTDYLQRHYRADNMAIAFCGPITLEEATELARENLGALPGGAGETTTTPPAMEPGPHWLAATDSGAQLGISLFFRGVGYRDADFFAMAALRRLLDDGFSARLQAQVREKKGLAYDLWAAISGYSDSGALEIGASVEPEKLDALFATVLEQLRLLRDEPPAPAEWRRLMTRWRANMDSALDRPAELMDRYVGDRLFAMEEPLSAAWERIEQLDPQQIVAAAQKLFRPENLVTVVVGPNAQSHADRLKKQFSATLAGFSKPG
ncbi:M16 family metallopeptidase [Magnetofaba australis]|uniref:Putative peptidase M16 domain-containing protein n=1 Tax=Magnetofaba australis IT-1 TaxID=1434232 RepID=A0A1Y2K838_9PROT|nr:pitrilysin family protein [Magnetofaba australis]OSM06172.1 putative peptidase M16 domain-containing protein [Magnetofaba australis IT-1]